MNNKVLSQESHEMTLAWHLSFLGRNIYPDGHSRLRMEESMANYVKPVVFLLGKEMYGVDINLVQSIEKDLNVVPVPNSQSYIKGIVNMRNEVIPVYSLARKFGKEQEATAESTIIISSGGLKLALEVDEVLEINDIDESHILPMPSMLVKADTQYLDRVANVDGKIILLLDVEKLLSDDEAEDVKKITEELQNG